MKHVKEENNKINFKETSKGKGIFIILSLIIIIAYISMGIYDVVDNIIKEINRPKFHLYSYSYNYSSASSIPSPYKRKYNSYGSSTQNSSSYYSHSKSYNSSSSENESSDPYNAKDYADAEDFYDDNYDDFYDYYDAEEYYNEHS